MEVIEIKEMIKRENLEIEDRYIEIILGLVAYLRINDYNIGINSVVDYFKLLPDINIFEIEEMIDVMKTVFAKNRYQYVSIKDDVSNYFFNVLESGVGNDLKKKLMSYMSSEGEKEQEEASIDNISINISKKERNTIEETESDYLDSILSDKELAHLKPILDIDIDEIKEQLLASDVATMESEIREVIMENIKRENKEDVNKNCILAGKKVKALSKKINDELMKNEKIENKMKKEMKLIEKKFSKEHRKEFTVGINAVILQDDILDKSIEKFTKQELDYVGEYIRINANKFKTLVSRTMKKDKKKNLDFKNTMKESVKTFGLPIELYYKKPKKKKTRIVCIMDISGSVKKHSKLLSHFIYEISSVFTGGVRSYAFIKELKEVTSFMTDYELSEGYEKAMAAVPRGYSDYNTALEIFANEYLKTIDKNTIVIIIGDARNNKNQLGANHLEQISQRAKTVIWLNPDDKKKWNQGDSIIDKYRSHINSLCLASTPNHLIDFLSQFSL